jgi:hypothetical protein
MTNVKSKRPAPYWLVMLMLSGVALAGSPSSGKSEPGGLEGSWKGGGWVSIAGGPRERAHCHLRYSAASGSQYSITATCATDSGKVSQTARVRKSGERSYQGSFYNSEYDVSGQIRVVLHGNSQTVTLSSDSGSAQLTLTR